jgi:hypothetical protein
VAGDRSARPKFAIAGTSITEQQESFLDVGEKFASYVVESAMDESVSAGFWNISSCSWAAHLAPHQTS